MLTSSFRGNKGRKEGRDKGRKGKREEEKGEEEKSTKTLEKGG